MALLDACGKGRDARLAGQAATLTIRHRIGIAIGAASRTCLRFLTYQWVA